MAFSSSVIIGRGSSSVFCNTPSASGICIRLRESSIPVPAPCISLPRLCPASTFSEALLRLLFLVSTSSLPSFDSLNRDVNFGLDMAVDVDTCSDELSVSLPLRLSSKKLRITARRMILRSSPSGRCAVPDTRNSKLRPVSGVVGPRRRGAELEPDEEGVGGIFDSLLSLIAANK